MLHFDRPRRHGPTGLRRRCEAGRPVQGDVPTLFRSAAERRSRHVEAPRAAAAPDQVELLAVAAHEMRNPLTPISMAASMLEQAGSDPAMLAYLRGVIERQVAHLSRLVDDLLDVSRIATGKLSIERRRADPIAIVRAAIDACRPALDARGQRLAAKLPADAPALHGDPIRLTQVVSNLLDNASKFSPDGGAIGVTLAVRPHALVIEVSDSGIGIASDSLPELFEPFVQGPRAAGERRSGLGIGLSVVREIVEAHGGTVSAHSAGSGLGSRFVVTLPMSRVGSRATNVTRPCGMAAA